MAWDVPCPCLVVPAPEGGTMPNKAAGIGKAISKAITPSGKLVGKVIGGGGPKTGRSVAGVADGVGVDVGWAGVAGAPGGAELC